MQTNLLEFGAEGMDKNFFISFKSHFLGVIPDYIIKAANKNNRATIYGSRMMKFYDHYNKVPQQYDYNASFADWDVLGGNIAYGYKYAFIGGNFALANTSLNAYQSVSNTKIKEQEPPDFYSFNSKGNFSYGANLTLGNNNPEKPLRLIIAYDLMLMRNYNDKWVNNAGNRIAFDFQSRLPIKIKEGKAGFYAGAVFRMHDIGYKPSVNGVEKSARFTSSIFSLRLGYYWD